MPLSMMCPFFAEVRSPPQKTWWWLLQILPSSGLFPRTSYKNFAGNGTMQASRTTARTYRFKPCLTYHPDREYNVLNRSGSRKFSVEVGIVTVEESILAGIRTRQFMRVEYTDGGGRPRTDVLEGYTLGYNRSK